MLAGILFAYNDLFILTVTRLFLWGYLAIPLTLSIDPQREFFPRALMITISTSVLLIPYVKLKWRFLLLSVAATSIFLAYDFRSNVLRIGFALLLVAAYYVRKYIPLAFLKFAALVCLVLPLIFLTLGVTDQYDIFKPTDDIDKYAIEYSNGVESNLANDTRTFLYEEVLTYMKSNDSFIFGEGATAKYKTVYFDEESVGVIKGRYGTEVGFLNILLYAGIVGVVLYALVLFSAVYYGIAYSNNYFCKMLAIFLAFRWILFFIEDFVVYDMNFYFLWMAIGLCLSKDFRALSDADIRAYFSFSGKKQVVPELS